MLPCSSEVICLSVELGNPSVIVGRILPKFCTDEQKTRVNGERQTMAGGDEQSGVRVRECLFYEQGGIFMVCLECLASDVGKTDWEQLGHTLDQLPQQLDTFVSGVI